MVKRHHVLILVLIEALVLSAIGLIIYVLLASAAPISAPLRDDAPVQVTISYQGRIDVAGTPFNGVGQFKFAIVDQDGSQAFWTNDGSSGTSPFTPTDYITLTVTDGLYAVRLGDPGISGMQQITVGVFSHMLQTDLRVWFNDGSNGWQMLTPDTLFSYTPYSLIANLALTSTWSTEAGYAYDALHSAWADTAWDAIFATNAQTATHALTATWATNAQTATYALTSTWSTEAGYAYDALHSAWADTAWDAIFATNAQTATHALTATWTTSATYATSALTATSATTVPANAYAANTALGARVSTTTILTMSHATYYRVPFETEAFDTDTIHSSNEPTLTCKTAGIYVISGDVRFSSVFTGTRIIDVLVNGSLVARQRSPIQFNFVPGLNISTIYQLNVSDAVTLQVYQDSGTTVQVVQSDFGMVRIP